MSALHRPRPFLRVTALSAAVLWGLVEVIALWRNRGQLPSGRPR